VPRRVARGSFADNVIKAFGQGPTNLFYRLNPCAWRQGVGSEAAAAVVEWSLQLHPARPVIARVRPANHTSARVALKAGLARAAELDSLGEDGPDWIFAHRAGRPPQQHRGGSVIGQPRWCRSRSGGSLYGWSTESSRGCEGGG
jgi:ribosomal-protein-alanine N-acetyltransferase